MTGLDTNVLVRFIVEDDPAQSERAARLIDDASSRGEMLYVSHVVICEVVWVLARAYRFPKPEVLRAVQALVQARQLDIQGRDVLRRALDEFAAGKGDLADYIIRGTAVEAGYERLATFDAALLDEAGFEAP